MKCAILTNETDICRVVAERLCDENHFYYIETDCLSFYENITSIMCDVDLILCDFKYNSSHTFNLFSILNEHKIEIPVVYYNDPVPADGKRAAYWLMQNEAAFCNLDFKFLEKEFNRIASVIEDPCIKPYISLLQPPKTVINQACLTENDLTLFRRRNHIPAILFKLLKYFYLNQQKELNIRQISFYLYKKIDFLGVRDGCVYSYISRLRKIIEKDGLIDAEIIRTRRGSYEFVLY